MVVRPQKNDTIVKFETLPLEEEIMPPTQPLARSPMEKVNFWCQRNIWASDDGESSPLTGHMDISSYDVSMPEAYHSIQIPHQQDQTWRSWLAKLLAYIGPGYLVAVGYMDPGNWSTDLAGGSLYKYDLLFVILLSNFLAIFLQTLAVKMGVVMGKDLAQACRDHFSPRVNLLLWIMAEVAIAATDLAEVVGSAIAMELLFGIPLAAGVCITALDVIIILFLFERNTRFRWLEIIVAILIFVIFMCFAIVLTLAKPNFSEVMHGMLVPSWDLLADSGQLYIAIGIVGATVMPHNLYLHSSVIQTRDFQDRKGEALRFSFMDTTFALCFALFINAAILIVSAAAFYDPTGKINGGEVPSISDAYDLLAPILGTKFASILFGIALLVSGQNSTLTGTLAGQIVMEGHIQIRLKPWLRRLVTRLVAVVPAMITIIIAGEEGVNYLLILSQVILSFQLSFAVFPLVMFTSNVDKMGDDFVNGYLTRMTGWFVAFLISALNVWLIITVCVGL